MDDQYDAEVVLVMTKGIVFDQVFEGEIGKNTGIRNANEKEHLFQWQIGKVNAGEVVRVETPDTCLCKFIIPDQKNGCYCDVCWKKILPFFVKRLFGVETRNKGNEDTPQINQ